MKEALAKKVREIAPEVVGWRHRIHRNPELSFQEFETSAYRGEAPLVKIDRIRRRRAGQAYARAVRYGKGPGRCGGSGRTSTAPDQERRECRTLPRKDGVFHGCGHDSHAAILLGTDGCFRSSATRSPGGQNFFQHAKEELGGGMEFMEGGLMENPRVDGVMALHALPDIYVGEIGVRDDFMTAGVDLLKVTVEGKQAHGGYPHYGVDTILAASSIVTALQSLGSRELAPTDCAFVTFGRIEGGISNSYIGGPVHLEG